MPIAAQGRPTVFLQPRGGILLAERAELSPIVAAIRSEGSIACGSGEASMGW